VRKADMDISIPLIIKGVPDEKTAKNICDGIRLFLLDNHATDMFVTFKDVTGTDLEAIGELLEGDPWSPADMVNYE
jgi:hypothetical protein